MIDDSFAPLEFGIGDTHRLIRRCNGTDELEECVFETYGVLVECDLPPYTDATRYFNLLNGFVWLKHVRVFDLDFRVSCRPCSRR